MNLKINSINIDLCNITNGEYDLINEYLVDQLNKKTKARDAIAETFLFSVDLCPNANPSDIWHHIIYRKFLGASKGADSGQSWRRTSGEALESFFAKYYNRLLLPNGIRLKHLIARTEKRRALVKMGLEAKIGDAKLDTILEGNKNGNWCIFGGAHIKASFAERVSDDVPTSKAMMDLGYFSPILTLDVKSFPAPHGDFVNRGELGTPEKPSEKRKYIEEHGSFDNCYVYNTRSIPSQEITNSGKYIYILKFDCGNDRFVDDVIDFWKNYVKKKNN